MSILDALDRTRLDRKREAGLLRADRRCECGRYEPLTRTGVIESRCRNCGGLPKHTTFGGRKDRP